MTLTETDLVPRVGDEPRPVVAEVDGIPISGLLATARSPRAVIVALHGGATTSAYYDCPGHPDLSLLRLASAAGFTTLALDRPGYGASYPYGDDLADPQRRIDLMYGAIDRHLDGLPRGAGVFLIAHSAGCETGARMAADPERGPRLLGLELCGTGREQQPLAERILSVRPRPDNAKVAELLWQPERLYPPEHVGGRLVGANGPRFEGQVVLDWPAGNFPLVARQIRIPVQFTVADHERVWRNDIPGLHEVAALFGATPRLVLNVQRGSAHNISVGHTATAYHLKVLSFAQECIVGREIGESTGPAIQFDGIAAPER